MLANILDLIRGSIRMSEVLNTDMASEPAGKPRASLRRPFLLALLSALIVGVAANAVRSHVDLWLLAAGAVLSFAGIYLILGLAFGVLRHRRDDQQEKFYDAIIDASGFGAVVTDRMGRALYGNHHFLQMAQKINPKRLVGFDILYAGYPDFAEPVFQLAQGAREGKTMHRDVRVAAGSSAPGAMPDQARWLRLAISPLSIPGHTLWRLLDITSDRQHQEQAFTRLQFIITYLDHAPAGFFSTLANGNVDYINATLAKWLGLDLAEVPVGKLKLAALIGQSAADLLLAVGAEGETSRTESFMTVIPDRSGKLIPVDIMHRADFDSAGKALPSRTMVLLRNTSRELAAGAVAEQFVSAVPFGVAQLSKDGTITASNAPFVALSPAIKIGGTLQSVLKESDRAAQVDAIQKADENPNVPFGCEATLIGDKPRAVELSFVKLPAVSNDIFAFVVDETESKALEVQLAQSQKMQAVGQLASGIAHDFNNVLTPIIGFADLLLSKMRPADPSFADVMNIKQNANRAANLVRQLLAFSRKQTMQPRIHSLTEAMSDLGNLLSRVLGEKTDLKIVHGRDLGLVMVDIHQFEQVIINLAVNARDAMPSGGTLTVRTYNVSKDLSRAVGHSLPEGEYVACEVEDTGTGIPPEIVDKIWEPFFSTKEVGKGTGLGLSMVYGIIKQTGGFIFCDSEIGRGTAFRIFLPRQYPAPKPIAVETKPASNAGREDFTGKGRILVVEDEDSVRAFANRALTTRGYTVVEANSGEVGLERVLEDKIGFELILSDVVMPEMDGPTFLSELRKRKIMTKFIFMSGYAEDAFERNLENPDDFAFLQKPFSLKQLAEKVKEVMTS
jgi:two-component system cell cycle sensor histidine kinase/response regulator CckA